MNRKVPLKVLKTLADTLGDLYELQEEYNKKIDALDYEIQQIQRVLDEYDYKPYGIIAEEQEEDNE